MKKRVLSGGIFFILGILTAIGPYTIFPVCKAGMKVMKCQNTAKVELVVGILIAVLGILLTLIKQRNIRTWLSLFGIPLGLLTFLFPNYIIGVCGHAHMTCRSLTLPALSIIGVVLILFAGFNAIYLWKFENKGANSNDATTDTH